jgi:hypothetical protein
MKQSRIKHVFHIENDNMLYIELGKLVKRMEFCGIRFAFPRAAVDQAVTSFVYAQTSEAFEDFSRWCVDVFRKGPDLASKYIGASWINDMTLGAHYLRLQNSSKASGVFELPTHFHLKTENCCLCYLSEENKEPIIFDACVLGQYFGGTFAQPNLPHWEQNRLVDPRGEILRWYESPVDRLKRPLIRDIHIVNIHVHSKQLEKFASSNTTSNVRRLGSLEPRLNSI